MSSKRRRITTSIISGILTFLLVCVFFTGVIIGTLFICYDRNYVKGHSMLPTINSNVYSKTDIGDAILINKYSDVTRNDIVTANVSWWNQLIIKRIVACPGDYLEIRENGGYYDLYVNNELLYQKKKSDATQTYTNYCNFLNNNLYKGDTYIDVSKNIYTKEDDTKCIHLLDNEYMLLGDNWNGSTDSMARGVVYRDEIIGRVDLIIDVNENKFLAVMKYVFTSIFNI